MFVFSIENLFVTAATPILVKYLLPLLAILCLAFVAQPSEAVEVLHNYYSMQDDTEELAGNYPDIAIYSEHASSTGLGLEIFSVDVALNITELSEEELAALPTMYVDGVHHGNEGMSAEAAFLFLQDVLERSAADPTYLEGKRLVVTPVMNADGYLEDCRNNWNGVDLNRNYPYMWGMYGTSDTRGSCPASGTYRGPSEGSEAETQANMEMMRGMNLYVYFSGHTGSNDIVLPWKITGEFAVPIADWDLYERFLNESANVSGLSYRVEYIRALGKIGNEEAINLLIRALGIQESDIYGRPASIVAGIHAAAEEELNKIPGGKERLSQRLKIVKTVLGGDMDDNTKKSNAGSGGDDKFTKLKELKEMLSEGLIDEDEFKQMKKEILGK